MSVILSVQTSTGEDIPVWFSRTDSKEFVGHLGAALGNTSYGGDSENELVRLLKHFGLALTPLLKVGGDDEPLDSFMARDPTPEREAFWHETQAREQAAWQPPEAFIGALTPFIKALEANPGTFAQLGITDFYFVEGNFNQDLLDLLHMFEWAQEHNIPRVRITVR
jgi:hypothetical protein